MTGGILYGDRTGAEMLAGTVATAHSDFDQTVQSSVDATSMQYTTRIREPLLQFGFQFIVVVRFMHGEICSCTLNAGAATFPDFLQCVFRLNKER